MSPEGIPSGRRLGRSTPLREGAAGRVVIAALAVAAIVAGSGCGRLKGAPTGRGWNAFRVGSMTLELPEDWVARGDASRIEAESPDGRAKVVAERPERAFSSQRACLAQAEEALDRGSGRLDRARRHPTRLGGREAIAQEADVRGWHGWAWAACDGAQQYRLSFFGVSPMAPDAVVAQRGLEASVRFDGKP